MFYIHWQLVFFRDNRRQDPQMSPLAANLSDADMADLAAYYAAQKPTLRPGAPPDPAKMDAGRRVARFYFCSTCHSPEVAEPRYAPNVAGLPYEYLLKQLRSFRAKTRDDLDGNMTVAVQPLSDEEIEILARYLSGLPPGARP